MKAMCNLALLPMVLMLLVGCGGGGGNDNNDSTSSWYEIFSDNFNRSDKMLNDDITYKIETCCGDDKNLFIESMKVSGSSSGDSNTSFAQLIDSFNSYDKIRIRALINFVADDTHVGFYLFNDTTYFIGSFEPLSISILEGNMGSAPVSKALENTDFDIAQSYIIEMISMVGEGIELNVYDASGETKIESVAIDEAAIQHENISLAMGDSDVVPPFATLDNLTIDEFE